jgi:DNA-binding IclR family transcriptional regulator
MHGLLKTLQTSGWVNFDSESRRYSLGIRAWEAGNTYVEAVDLSDRARPYMTAVRDALDETVQLAVLDGRFNVYIAKVDGSNPLRLESTVGRRLQAHATGLGKVLLADLDKNELSQRLDGVKLERFTSNTITQMPALRRELALTRKRGYGRDEEEYTVGVQCIAAPIRDSSGRVTAGMSVSVPSVRFLENTQSRAADTLLEEAANLSAALGFRD